MCLQLNNSLRGNCKCKFADSCKVRITLEQVMTHVGRDKACLVSIPRPKDTATTIDLISNNIYPPSNFVGCL
jgi:hypothetical protein